MLKKMSLALAAFALLSATCWSAAEPKAFPRGCKPVGFSYADGKLILTPVSESSRVQTIFLLHNHGAQSLQFRSEKLPDQDFAPQYIHTMEADQWSAFSMSSHRLQFVCSSHESSPINCAESLSICQYPRAKFADHNSGTYWLKSASTLQEMIQIIVDDGILLRW